MADGDITAVKVLYRQTLGGGQNASGNKKNDKVLVVGEITATYVSGGIACNKYSVGSGGVFGVTNIDFVKIEPTLIQTAASSDDSLLVLSADPTNQKIFLSEDLGVANPAIPSDQDAIILKFICVGDDAGTPELT